MNTKLEALRDLLSGRLAPDLDHPLRQELNNPESPASQFLEGLRLATEVPEPGAIPPPTEARLFPSWATRKWFPMAAGLIAATVLFALVGFGGQAWIYSRQFDLVRQHEQALTDQVAALAARADSLASELQQERRANIALQQRANQVEKLAQDQVRKDPLSQRIVMSLEDKSPQVRQQAAVFLGLLGHSAEFAAPAVRNRMAVEKDVQVYQALNATLSKIEQK